MGYRNILLFGLAIIAGLAAVLATQELGQSYTFKGSIIEPPLPAQDFTLYDQHNQPFRLSDQRGEVVLIFFGYTHCPDVCPLTLADFKQIKAELAADADRVNFLFITVDPARDTPERLAEHMANFDPAIRALIGDREELEAVWKSFGVYAARAESGSAAGYLVDHTARVYAIDANGDMRMTYAFGTEREAIVQDVAHLLAERPSRQ